MPDLDRYILMDGTLSGADWNDTNPNTRKYIYDKPDKIYEPIQDLKNIKDNIDINPNNGNVIKATLIGNINITILPNDLTNKSRSITLILKNIGAYNLSFSGNVRWSGNVIPDFSVYSTGVITLIANDDEVWYGNISDSYNDFTPPPPPDPREWNWSKYTSDPTYNIVDGRQFVRHPSNMGTVMSFNDGQDRSVLVLDAMYRKAGDYAYYSDSSTDLNSLLSDDMKLDICKQVGYSFGSSKSLPFEGCTDTEINTSYSTICNQDTKGSKYNTDSLVSLGENSQAANYCRSITVNGEGCDMPNINTLIRIYASMIQLDSMDPTISSYPNLALSNWFNNENCLSSTWGGLMIVMSWFTCLSYKYDSQCVNPMQNTLLHKLLPVLELI